MQVLTYTIEDMGTYWLCHVYADGRWLSTLNRYDLTTNYPNLRPDIQSLLRIVHDDLLDRNITP